MTFEIEKDPVWYPYTSIPVQGPRTKIAGAKGQYIFTEDGHKLFDATSSWWCQIHGHSHPRLVSALTRQAETLDHVMMAPHSHEPAQGLAKDLLELMGPPFEKVFFSDDGSTAVEVALKMLLQYWRMKGEERTAFLTLKNAYHGDTLGTVALSGTDIFHRHFKSGDNSTLQGEAPYCYRCPVNKSYPDCEIACLASVEQLLQNNARHFAGAVIEPLVLGAGGMIVYPKEYLEEFSRLCHEYGVPVIFDEVFTGFGRTGKLFAFEHIQTRPDLVCLSKGLTSGMMPLGLTVTTGQIFREFLGGSDRTFYHGHTFTGNPLACAVARESLAIFKDEKVLESNEKLIDLLSRQKERFLSLPGVGDVRQQGMIWALEFKGPQTNELGWKICGRLWERGFWLRPLHQMLYLVPPYCSTVADLNDCLQALEEAIGFFSTTRNE